MTRYIVDLFGYGFWETLFVSCFFFGLVFFIFVIIGSMGDDEGDIDSDADADAVDTDVDTDAFDMESDFAGELLDIDGDGVPDGWDFDGDGVIDLEFDLDMDSIDLDVDMDGLDLDADIDPDLDLDTDLDADMGLDADLDADLDGEIDLDDFEHVELDANVDAEPRKDTSIEYRSSYKMGNVSSFLFAFGGSGWINLTKLSDLDIVFAIVLGYATMKAFDWIIANYAKTVINPIFHIERGDIGLVIYGISPDKAGIIHVKRKDGVVSTVIARGAFPHDYFDKGDRGYVWAKRDEIYYLTRGVVGQPDLQTSNSETSAKPKKKAMDLI